MIRKSSRRYRQPRRALLVSRTLAGHRQIYLHVLAQYLIERDFELIIATDENQNSPLLDLLKLDPRVRAVAIRYGSSSTALVPFAFIKQIQAESEIGLSVFVDGDDLRRSLVASRFDAGTLGPSLGIFLQLTRFSPLPKLTADRRSILSTARYLRNWFADEVFFGYTLKGANNSFQAFVLDPRLPEVLSRSYLHWLPDIYAPFADDASIEQADLYAEIQAFLAESADQERILYYGTNQLRRGYEWLFRLVAERSNTVLIHCGRLNEYQDMTEGIRLQRLKLMSERRLFETGCFITDRRITDRAYTACKYVLLPYQSHYGSSGVMLQALSYGKPVLVPRGGLMAYWADRYKFGRTYSEGKYENFLQEWLALQREYHSREWPARQFISRFTREQVYMALDHGLAQVEQ